MAASRVMRHYPLQPLRCGQTTHNRRLLRRLRRPPVVSPPVAVVLSPINEDRELECSEPNGARLDLHRNYSSHCVFSIKTEPRRWYCGGCCNPEEEEEEDWDCCTGYQHQHGDVEPWRVTLATMVFVFFSTFATRNAGGRFQVSAMP